MRIVRFVHNDTPTYGVVEGELPEISEDGTLETSGLEVAVLNSDPFFSPAQSTGERIPYDDLRLVAPILPRSKVIGVGRNFADHAKEMGNEVPVSPLTFFKPNTAVVGPGEPIRLPAISENVSYEAELAVVISKVAKHVTPETAYDYVLGYTASNDVTLRDIQNFDNQWSRAKGFDSSCPLGPWIETDFDPDNVRIRSWVNGQKKQDGNTQDFIFDIPTVIAHLTEVMTLLPGDVILTGTPEGVGQIIAGDRVSIGIDGLGLLTNPVMDA